MRLFATLVALAIAFPVVAQPALTDSSDTYVVPAFGIGGSDGVDMLLLGLEAGTRLSPTVDVGAFVLGGDNRLGPGGAYLTFGPTAGYSTQIGLGLEANLRGRVRATFEDFSGPAFQDLGFEEGFKLRTAQATAQATVSRPFKLVGSLAIAPVAGAYATTCLGFNGGVGPGGQCAEAGAVAGLDLRFRLLGADVSVPLVLGFPLVGGTQLQGRGSYTTPVVPLTTGIRVRF